MAPYYIVEIKVPPPPPNLTSHHLSSHTCSPSVTLCLSEGVRTTSVTAKALTENSPFHAQDGLLYNGEKLSKLYEINLHNGQLLNDFSSSSEQSGNVKSDSTVSFIVGRVDYVIRAFNTDTGREEVWLLYSLFLLLDFALCLTLSLSLSSSTSPTVRSPLSQVVDKV
jgi:hypothetical protein